MRFSEPHYVSRTACFFFFTVGDWVSPDMGQRIGTSASWWLRGMGDKWWESLFPAGGVWRGLWTWQSGSKAEAGMTKLVTDPLTAGPLAVLH